MEATYERSLNETWLLLPGEEPEDEYACRLLEQNRCRHLLRLERRRESGETIYAFAVSCGSSLSRVFQMSPMTFPGLRQLLTGISGAVEEAESCLLELDHLILEPELIFASPDMEHLLFCCHPGCSRDFFRQLRDLMRYCVRKIDHQDKAETETVYRLLDICEQEYYRFEDLMEVMGKAVSEQTPDLADSPERGIAENRLPEREPDNAGRKFPEQKSERAAAGRWLLPAGLLLAALLFGGVFLWFGIREQIWDWRYGAAAACMMISAAGTLVLRIREKKQADEEGFPDSRKPGTGYYGDSTELYGRSAGYTEQSAEKHGGDTGYEVHNAGRHGRDTGYEVQNAGRHGRDTGYTERNSEKHKRDTGQSMQNAEKYGGDFRYGYAGGNSELHGVGPDRQGKPDPYEYKSRKPLPPVRPDTELSPETTFLGETTFLPEYRDPEEDSPRLIPAKRKYGPAVSVRPLPFVIGTLAGEADMLLSERSVSRIHARIEEEDGQYLILDCRSTNGTWVNGIRLRPEEKYPLQRGDEIRVADIRMRFE